MKMADEICNPKLRTEPFVKLRDELWQQWRDRHMSAIPHTLYHYTDASGLLGILASKCLWATDSRYLNDNLEIEYGLGLLREVLDETSQLLDAGPVKDFLETADNISNPFDGFYGAYVVCFCEKGDQLSQWRAYGD